MNATFEMQDFVAAFASAGIGGCAPPALRQGTEKTLPRITRKNSNRFQATAREYEITLKRRGDLSLVFPRKVPELFQCESAIPAGGQKSAVSPWKNGVSIAASFRGTRATTVLCGNFEDARGGRLKKREPGGGEAGLL